MTVILPLLALAAATQQPAALPPGTPFGPPTTITLAGNGALRDWTRGPAQRGRADTLYVRDRNERWYQVTLTGPCRIDRALDTLTYTTDATGTFDRFSRLRVLRYPGQLCGVQGIRRSSPPKAYPQPRRR